jgi:hypothetical protein
VSAWRSAHFCDTLLANPTSNAKVDVARRAAVRARITAFNAVLARVCTAHPRCTTDAGALFRLTLRPADLSTNDYWHASIAGQSAIARAVWDTLGY